MAISVKDVQYLALLARVQLNFQEAERFTSQLEEILTYVERLKAARIDGVAPTSHVLSLSNVFREDQVQPSLPTAAALANAPATEGPFFKVPRIIDAT